MLRGEIHKSGQVGLAELGGTCQSDLIVAMQFEHEQSCGFQRWPPFEIRGPWQGRRQFQMHSSHVLTFTHP